MPVQPSSSNDLETPLSSERAQALHYLEKHQRGLSRLGKWRDQQLARQALKIAGEPGLILDLPSGAGRFWPVLAEHANRVILAADPSLETLSLAEARSDERTRQRIKTFQTSISAIELPANAVDCIFSMRLFHHIAESSERCEVLREFHRVTRDTAIIALWVDGNIKSWRRKRLEQCRATAGQAQLRHNRFVVARSQIEAEFREAGFSILAHHDVLPGYSMWRVYVLRKPS